MKLKKPLFTSLAILALAVPVTSGAIVTFSASPAIAKGKDKGGSDRGSRSDRGRSDRDKGSRGSSSRGSSSNSRGGNGNGGGGGNAYGAGNGNGGNGQSTKVKPAKAAPTAEPESMDGELDMHPSQLGSMNGAMNANINAVLAHIRNGNINGPVGALAGLAVADHDAAEAQTVIETSEKFTTLDSVVEAAGYTDLEEYLGSGEINEDIDAALAALGDAERPSEDEVIDAQAAIDALPEAEAAIFDAWNKSDLATEEEKAALLDALRARLEEEGTAIDEAIASSDEDGDEMDGDEGDEDEGTGEETAEDTSGEDDESGDDGDDSDGDEGDGDDDGEEDGTDDGEDDGEDEGEETAALDAKTKAMIDGLTF